MTFKKYRKQFASSILTVAMTSYFAGCAEDPSMYQDETLTFETPVTSKAQKATVESTELDLADNKSDFYFTRIGAYVPWGPTPLFEYYRHPVPVEIPVAPGFSLVDYVHPFYAFAELNPFWDDDDGLYFRPDDD